MRNTLLILIATITLAACGKEKKRCWGCVLTYTDNFIVAYNDSMICDKTQSEIATLKRQTFDATDKGYEFYRIDHCSRIR